MGAHEESVDSLVDTRRRSGVGGVVSGAMVGVASGVWYEVHLPSLLFAGVSLYLYAAHLNSRPTEVDELGKEKEELQLLSLPSFVVGFVVGKETLRYYGERIASICFH